MQDKKTVIYWSATLIVAIFSLIVPAITASKVGLIGIGSLAIVVASWAISAQQWNRKLVLPSGFRSWAMLASALTASVLGVVWGTSDFQFLAGALLVAHFLTSHARQKRVSLGAFAAPGIVVGVAAIPSLTAALAHHCADLAGGGTTGLMRLYRIPHALDVHRLFSEHVIWDFQLAMGGIASPVLYVALCGILMALMKRCWLHIVLGTAITFYLSIAYHSGVPAMKAIAALWDWPILGTLAPAICFVIVVLVFLSADRLLEAIFNPVAPDDNASAANPLVHYWNTAFSPRISGKSRGVSPSLVRFLVPCLALAVVVAPAAASLPSQLSSTSLKARAVSFEPTVFAGVFNDAVRSAHVARNTMYAEELGSVFDQWEMDCLEYEARIVVCQSGDAASYDTVSFDADEWSESPPPDDPQDNTAEVGDFVAPKELEPITSTDTAKVTRLYHSDGRNVLLLESTGDAVSENPAQIKMFAKMPFGTNPRLERVLLERFESVLQIANAQLKSGGSR
jgi:hypothetical protein